jgi:lipopolysaccharide transport system permease protein
MAKELVQAEERVYDADRPYAGALREAWAYRELAYFLAWRDIKVRYKQTMLGVLWALLRPVVAMAVFTFVFHRMAGLSSGLLPYPLVALAGILGWNLMSEGISAGSASVLGNPALITKVYFPRIVIPFSALARGAADLAPALLVFGCALVWYGVSPGWSLALLPVACVHALAVSLGISLWFSAAAVRYRDVAHALPFVLQVLFWMSPVGYDASSIPDSAAIAYWANPMTAPLQLFRAALLGQTQLPVNVFLLSTLTGLIILLGGAWYFHRMEADFADVI